MAQIQFSKEQEKEIIHFYEKNLLNPRTICTKFNVSITPIISVLKRNNIDMSRSNRRKLLFASGKLNAWNKNLTKGMDSRIIGTPMDEKHKEKIRMALKKEFSEKQKNQIINFYENELLNCEEISKRFNCSSGTILKLLRENKINTSYSHRKELLFKNGKLLIWNKNLTKETDERLKNQSNLIKFQYKTGERKGFEKGNNLWKTRIKSGTNKEKVELECTYCHNKFKVINSRKNETKYCSIKCYRLAIPSWNIGLTTKTNETLKRAIDNRMKTVRKLMEEGKWNVSEATRKKISLATSMENNPRWLGGISFEPYTKEFNKQFKLLIRERDNFTCMKCNLFEVDCKKLYNRILTCHHIDYIKENTIPENCCALCLRCNVEVNANRNHWTKFFQSMLHEKYGYNYSEDNQIILNINSEIKNGL